MTLDVAKSIQVVNLDAWNGPPSPLQISASGNWGPGILRQVDGYITANATNLGSANGSNYRLVRFPVAAKIKSLDAQSTVLDSNASQTLALDWNLAFSDSTGDGTSTNNQAAIPTTAGAGAVTTVAAYSSPNKLWGTITQAGNNAAIAKTDLTFNGTNFTSTTLTNGLVVPYKFGYTNIPIWKLFTFVNAQGYETPPDGYFDVFAYAAVKAATGAAGTLWARLTYVM